MTATGLGIGLKLRPPAHNRLRQANQQIQEPTMTNKTFGGELNDSQSFLEEISRDARLQARHDMAVQYVAQRAAEHGFKLTPGQIQAMPSFRLAVLAGESFGPEFERELFSFPEFAQAQQESAQASAAKEGKDEALEAISRMHPSQRMAYARKHGLDRPADAAQESEALKQTRLEIANNLSPAKRLAYAREHGLI